MEESRSSSPCMTDTPSRGYHGLHRSVSPHRDENSDESEPPRLAKIPCIEDLVEMIRKQIYEDKPQSRGNQGSSILRISDFSLSKKIISYKFPKKFVIPNFGCYIGVTDPIQHLRAYW